MESARQTMLDGSTWFRVEGEGVRAVVLKLARGHAAYELAEPLLEKPESLSATSFAQMTAQARTAFEATPPISVLPEVGSRAMQLLVVGDSNVNLTQPWIVVQPDNYRYLAIVDHTHLIVRLVIREYLAGEVIWRTT